MTMKVLCLDGNSPDSVARTKALEHAGFVVLQVNDDARAQHLLENQHVDVVCVHSHSVEEGKTSLVSKVKALLPHVPLVLIHDSGAVPERFEEYADVIVDEGDFRRTAESLIHELRDMQCPFFVHWFEDWQRRSSDRNGQSPFPA